MLQQSIYTHIFTRNDRFFIYNSKNALFAEISEDLYEALFNRDYEVLPEEILTNLRKQEVLVEEENQYLHYMESKLGFYASSYDPTYLALVIAPTTGCNFDCPYCFEGHKESKFMSDEVENQIIDFIKGRPLIKTVSINWYGGEPLMAFNRMRSLYDKINALENISINRHAIITNGHLINDEIIDFFKETNLSSIQITLDGNETSHNKTRCLKGSGAPTYDAIVKNIKRLTSRIPEINLSIRVNINRKNSSDFIEVYNWISDMLPDAKKLSIYPGFIREDAPDKCSNCYTSLSNHDRFRLLSEISRMGCNINFMPLASNRKSCMINNYNSFIIGPEGEMYKCWNDFNHPERIIGYISQKEFQNKRHFLYCMTESDIYSDDECKNCLVFPVCSGKCGYYNLKNKFEKGKYEQCPAFKDKRILEEALLLTLEKKNNENCKPVLHI